MREVSGTLGVGKCYFVEMCQLFTGKRVECLIGWLFFD